MRLCGTQDVVYAFRAFLAEHINYDICVMLLDGDCQAMYMYMMEDAEGRVKGFKG